MSIKKISDTAVQEILDATKILAEDNITGDKFAHITGTKLIDYIVTKNYLTETEILALTNIPLPENYIFARTKTSDVTINQKVEADTNILVRSDDNTTNIFISAGFRKGFGSFSVGDGNGGLDTGIYKDNRLYFVWAIYNPTTNLSDILISLSNTSPTMPAGYTQKRLVGAFKNFNSLDGENFEQYQHYDIDGEGKIIPKLPFNYMSKFTIEAQPVNRTVEIGQFECKDSTNVIDIKNVFVNFPNVFLKEVDITWAEGVGNGMLASGATLTDYTLFTIYAIVNSSNGALDFILENQQTTLTPPTDYDLYKIIGYLWTEDYSVSGAYISYSVNQNEEFKQIINYKAPALDLDEGTVTAGSLTTLEDSTKAWTTDEFIGKVVEIDDPNGLNTYGIVTTNSNTELTFDNDLDYIPVSGDKFKILNTINIQNELGNSIIALNIIDNSCAVVLPEVEEKFERIKHTVYIEKAINGYSVPIVAYGNDNIRTKKNAVLFRASEFLTFTLHTYLTNHWDILYQENIRRFASSYFDADESLASATYVPIGATANIEVDYSCRFIEVNRSGITWLMYNSLFPQLFSAKLLLTIERGGGGGSSVVNIAVRRDRGGVITDFEERESAARFAADGIQTIAYSSPVELEYGDYICPIANRDTGTVSILSGSHFDLKEL